MEKKCNEKIELLDKYNSYVIEPLKLIINKEDDKKKKVISKKDYYDILFKYNIY